MARIEKTRPGTEACLSALHGAEHAAIGKSPTPTLGEYDFVSIVEVPDQNAIQHFFRRGILAAAHGSFQVCTLPALPFEEFVKVVDEIRPSEPPTTGVNE